MKTRGESGLRSLPLKIVFGPPLQMLCVVVVVNAVLWYSATIYHAANKTLLAVEECPILTNKIPLQS